MKLRNKSTGEIADFKHKALLKTDGDGNIVVWTRRANDYKVYESLKALNCFWEDYTPKEPLIKDEKIRKAVRAWAEANDIGVVKFRAEEHRLFDKNVAIEFDAYFFEELQDGWNYAIAELCGE